MNRCRHVVRLMAGQGHCVEREQVRVFVSRQPGKACGVGSDFLIAHQRPVQARSAPVRHQVGDRVIHRIIRAAVVGPVVALKIDRLRHVVQHHAALRILRWLGGGALVRFWA